MSWVELHDCPLLRQSLHVGGLPAGVKLLETECADLEHKAHPALDKLTVRVRSCDG